VRAGVAVLGTGTMGAPIARNLARTGLRTSAWNRSADKAEPLAADGVEVARSPQDACRGREIVLTMLADADAALDVAEQALPAAADGAVWLQASTIGIEGTERCGQLAERHGVALVDAPVLGTKAPAEAGELVVLASGAPDALERCDPVFAAIGSRTLRLGAAGSGTRLKLAVNGWVVAVTEGVAEAIALAQGLGLDPQLFFDAVEGGPLDLPYARLKGALMLRGEFPASFALGLAAKDAALAVAAAERHGLDLPLQRVVAQRMADGVAAGHGDEDMAATYRLSAPRAPPAGLP
jgi:3-hydroxyisobutyrate dehydrogenase